MKKYKSRGKLPKAQFGPVPMKPIKKSIDRIRRGPGILPPDSLRPNRGNLKMEYVEGSGTGPVPVRVDIDSFRKKSKQVRSKMQKGGSLRRSIKHR